MLLLRGIKLYIRSFNPSVAGLAHVMQRLIKLLDFFFKRSNECGLGAVRDPPLSRPHNYQSAN